MRVSLKIARQIAARNLADARANHAHRPGVIARAEREVADLAAMKGRWVDYDQVAAA